MKKQDNSKKSIFKKTNLFLTFLGAGLVIPIHGIADEINVGFGQDKPPFVIGSTKKGLEIDIFQEALAYKGHTIKIHHMPNKRLQFALAKDQKLDAVASVRPIPGEDDGFHYVDDFAYYDNVAISKKRDNLKVDEISDLVGLKLATWQNAYRDLGPEFESLFKPTPPEDYKKLYGEHASQKSQNLVFWGNRAEIILIDKTIFGWYRQQLGDQVDTTPEVVYHHIFSGRTVFQAAFESEDMAKDFEAGLKHLKESGRYDELYTKYM